MASRIRGDNQLFEVIVEAARESDSSSVNATFRFVHPRVDQDVTNSVIKFVFPFDPSFESPTVDSFTFVLTDGDGIFKFGFCRLSAASNVCHCIVSYHPWFAVFYRLLNYFAELRKLYNDEYIVGWVDSLLRNQHFYPGKKIVNSYQESMFEFDVPDPSLLMTIPNSINLTEYYCAVDVNNMMEMFASTLFERQILVTSKRLSRLTSCIHSAANFLFPFHWQHIFIPILPPHLLDFCSAPIPFLIGVHSSLWSEVEKQDLKGVVILDADKNFLHSSYNDFQKFPRTVASKLQKLLTRSGRSKTPNFNGDVIPRAFLRTLAALFGDYKSAFKYENDEVKFDNEIFINSRPESFQPFLSDALQLQIFQKFIDERMTLISSTQTFSDAFEEEIKVLEVKTKQKSKFEDFKQLTKKFIKMDVHSCAGSKTQTSQKSQTPNFSKKLFQKIPRKMSANFIFGMPKEFRSSKKQLSSSNSTDELHPHIKQQSFARENSVDKLHYEPNEIKRDVQHRRENSGIRDALNWSEPVSSASSYETVEITSQESLEINSREAQSVAVKSHDDLSDATSNNYFTGSLMSHGMIHNPDSRVGINFMTCSVSICTSEPHISKNEKCNTLETVSNKLFADELSKNSGKNVRHLIKLYEDNQKKDCDSTLKTNNPSHALFPGTYFPPNQTPSSIAARQANLQVATEQWKKKYRSRNIADVSVGISNAVSKFPQSVNIKENVSTSFSEHKPNLSSSAREEDVNSSDVRDNNKLNEASIKCNVSTDSLSKRTLENQNSLIIGTISYIGNVVSSPESDARRLLTSQPSQASKGVSSTGLSRRLAFKESKSQSSSESQKDRLLEMFRKSLKESSNENRQTDDTTCNNSDSDCDSYSTPPPLPLSSPPPLIDDCALDKTRQEFALSTFEDQNKKEETLRVSNVNYLDLTTWDDNVSNVSTASTASSYSSFSSPTDLDSRNFNLPSDSFSQTKSGVYSPLTFHKTKSNGSKHKP